MYRSLCHAIKSWVIWTAKDMLKRTWFSKSYKSSWLTLCPIITSFWTHLERIIFKNTDIDVVLYSHSISQYLLWYYDTSTMQISAMLWYICYDISPTNMKFWSFQENRSVLFIWDGYTSTSLATIGSFPCFL